MSNKKTNIGILISSVLALFITLTSIYTWGGGVNASGAPKSAATFSTENIMAILKSPEVAKVQGTDREIVGLKLLSEAQGTRTYRVMSMDYRSKECVFDVDVTNSHDGMFHDVKASNVRVVEGCTPTFTNQLILNSPLRLACSFNTGAMQYIAGSPDMITLEKNFEYAEVIGTDKMVCTKGCNSSHWKVVKDESSEFKGLKLISPIDPIITFQKGTNKLGLKIGIMAGLESQTAGRKINVSSEFQLIEEDQMIYREVRVDEELSKDQSDKTHVYRNNAWSEIRCGFLQPGETSEAAADEIKNRPPAPGTISLEQYQNRKGHYIIAKDQDSFNEVVKLAEKVDPAQVKAEIQASRQGLVEALRKIAPSLREALRANPKMTNNEAWARVSRGLGIEPMSPTGINSIVLMPLIMVEKP